MFDVLIIDALGEKHNFRDVDQMSTTDASDKKIILDPKTFSLDDVNKELSLKVVDKSLISFPKEDIKDIHIKMEDF